MVDFGESPGGEVLFLQQMSDAGKLIVIQGTQVSSAGVACSYTPASGVIFVTANISGGDNGAAGIPIQARWNSSVVASMGTKGTCYLKGYTVTGDGTKVFDLYLSPSTGFSSFGTLEAYTE